jgi:hypothetical protein
LKCSALEEVRSARFVLAGNEDYKAGLAFGEFASGGCFAAVPYFSDSQRSQADKLIISLLIARMK